MAAAQKVSEMADAIDAGVTHPPPEPPKVTEKSKTPELDKLLAVIYK
jgi:hypothetical protein